MAVIARLLDIDRAHLDVRLAAGAIVAILIAGVFEVVIGQGALQAAVAAFLVSSVGRSGDLRTRISRMVAVTIVGGAVGLLAYVSAETAWLAAIILAAVCYVTGLAYAYGPSIGRVGYVLLLWSLTVLIGEAHGSDPPTTAVAFFVGGLVAIGVTIIRVRLEDEDRPAAADAVGAEVHAQPPSVSAVAMSDLGVWSLVRAVLSVIAVLIGYQLSGDVIDPFWIALALLLVLVPDRDQARFKAAQRGVGTFLGVVSTVAILSLTDSEAVMILLTLVATFVAVAFYRANYMIYAFFITNAVLFYYWLATGEGPSQRLAATLIGIGLGLAGVAVVGILRPGSRRSPGDG